MRKVCLIGILTLILFAFWSQEAKGDDVIITLSESKGMSEVWNFWRTNDFNRDELNRWYYCEPSNVCKRGFADMIKEVNKIKSFRNLPVGYEIVIPDSLLENSETASEQADHNVRSTERQSNKSFKQHNTPDGTDTASANQNTTQRDSLSWNNTRNSANATSYVRAERNIPNDSTSFFNFHRDSSSRFSSLRRKASKNLQERWFPEESKQQCSLIDVEEVKKIGTKADSSASAEKTPNKNLKAKLTGQRKISELKNAKKDSSRRGRQSDTSTTAVAKKWDQIKLAEKLYGGTVAFILLLGLIELFRS